MYGTLFYFWLTLSILSLTLLTQESCAHPDVREEEEEESLITPNWAKTLGPDFSYVVPVNHLGDVGA